MINHRLICYLGIDWGMIHQADWELKLVRLGRGKLDDRLSYNKVYVPAVFTNTLIFHLVVCSLEEQLILSCGPWLPGPRPGPACPSCFPDAWHLQDRSLPLTLSLSLSLSTLVASKVSLFRPPSSLIEPLNPFPSSLACLSPSLSLPLRGCPPSRAISLFSNPPLSSRWACLACLSEVYT